MSRIDIRHAHSLTRPKAKKAVDEVATKLAERFGIDYAWEGDVLNFSRPGVEGQIAMGAGELHVHAKLGFFAAMFKEPIESEIRRVLQEKF